MITQIYFKKIPRDTKTIIKFFGGDKLSEGFFAEADDFKEAHTNVSEKLKEFLKNKKISVHTIKCSASIAELYQIYGHPDNLTGALCWEYK